jgi:hypothetical protein
VLQRHEGELQRCYEDAVVAELMNASQGVRPAVNAVRLDVQIEIAARGEVDHVELSGEAGADLKKCVTDTILGWRFPAATASTRFRLPVIFQPNIVQR